jgi:hypothetical protein
MPILIFCQFANFGNQSLIYGKVYLAKIGPILVGLAIFYLNVKLYNQYCHKLQGIMMKTCLITSSKL